MRQQTAAKQHYRKTPMNGLLGTFFLKDFDAFFDNFKYNNVLADEALLAFEHLIPTLNEFFDLCDDLSEEMAKETKIRWYGHANASSNDYIRAKSKYYDGPSFSDVSINMSEEESEDYDTHEGACFGKVLMLINVEIKSYSSFDLALVQWYDFRYKNDVQRSYKYGCPLLQITDMYNVIPIESIIELVQVIQRAEKENEYFVNMYMF